MKKLVAVISGLIAYLSLPLIAFAQAQGAVDPCAGTGASSGNITKVLCDLGGPNLGQTIRNVVIFFIVIAVVLALMYLLYGGAKWITSKGDKTEVEAARNHIMAAIAGLIVILLAVFIMSIVLGAFGIQFANLMIPNITGSNPQQ